jgi:hypothetical protein
LQAHWASLVQNDPAPLHAAICSGATNKSIFSGVIFAEPSLRWTNPFVIDGLHHKGETIRLVNKGLSNPMAASSDALIAAVSILITMEVCPVRELNILSFVFPSLPFLSFDLSTTVHASLLALPRVKVVNFNMLGHEFPRCFALYCRVFESSFASFFHFPSFSGFLGNQHCSSLNTHLILLVQQIAGGNPEHLQIHLSGLRRMVSLRSSFSDIAPDVRFQIEWCETPLVNLVASH